MSTQYHATVLMQGKGPFVRAVQHIEDIRELHTFLIENKTVYMFSGRMWVQKQSRWILVMGVTVKTSDEPLDFPYEEATWVGTWQ